MFASCLRFTLLETNIASKNGWLEYDPFLLGPGLFSGAKMLVSGRVLQIMSYKKVLISFATSYRGQFNEASPQLIPHVGGVIPLDFTLSVLKFYHHLALTYIINI